jgi:hypothetical protein
MGSGATAAPPPSPAPPGGGGGGWGGPRGGPPPRGGGGGRGNRSFLWKRYTNIGQLLVFPGFVNLVTLAVLIDLVTSVADGQYPNVEQTLARTILVGLLGIVHLVHQIRAAAQGFEVLRRL